MRATRAAAPLHLTLFAGAAALSVAGIALNFQGHLDDSAGLALLAGLIAFAAGILHRTWRFALPLAALAALAASVNAGLTTESSILPVNIAGLAMLLVGGAAATHAYGRGTLELRRRLGELDRLGWEHEEKDRLFMSATQTSVLEAAGEADIATAAARQTGATIGLIFVEEGAEFAPRPGVGLERLKPQAVAVNSGVLAPLFQAVEQGRPYEIYDARELRALFEYSPPDYMTDNALILPMRIATETRGFLLLANKEGGFSSDERRVAVITAAACAARLATLHAEAARLREAARYKLFNELVREASGRTFDEVLVLVLSKGSELIQYDSARIAVLHPEGTYTVTGGSETPNPVGHGPLASVLQGRILTRQAVTAGEGLLSGLLPGTEGGAVSEALVPIKSSSGVIGAICLGRRSPSGFGAADLPTLEELGAIAGVAVENAHVVERISGQAVKLDTALDALGEMSAALTTMTEGIDVLELKTLESAARLFHCDHAILTRAVAGGGHRVVAQVGFPSTLIGVEFKNGQGLIGAVILSGRAVGVGDLSASWDLAEPALPASHLRGALCVPMRHGEQFWGTLAVFDSKPRVWTEDDLRVLSTLGNEAVVAVKNAELYDQSKRSIWELTNLHEGLQAVTSTLDLDHVIELVASSAAKASEAQIGCLAIEEGRKLKVVSSYGTDTETADRLALGLCGDLCRDVMESGEPLMEDLQRSGSHAVGPLDPRAVLVVPINLHRKPIGLVFLANYVGDKTFNQDHQRLVTALATQAAVAIDNARLFRDRGEVMLSALYALAAAVDARDPYTAGHSERVTEYTLTIARHVNYAPGDDGAWRRLRQGVLVHDIGKIGVPDSVLQKRGRLTEEEFDQMRQHPVVGYNILKGLKLLSDELIVVRSHHERYDGKGYPDRKRGHELPIYAWVVSVADAFDAMTSDRPYRRGMSLEAALAEIERNSGSHFHPDVVEAALDAAAAGALRIINHDSLYADAPVLGAFQNPTF